MTSTNLDPSPILAPEVAKPRASALVPFVVFIGLITITAIVMALSGNSAPFGHMSAVVALFIAVVVAFAMYPGKYSDKVDTFIAGAGQSNIVIMVLTVLLAGAFASVAEVSGGVDSFVNLSLSLVPASLLVAGIFIASSIMSLATGSSSGTTAAIGPIAIGLGLAADLNMPLVFAAVLSGAFFGDNLSVISDTTIVVTRGQGVNMRDKFNLNWWIAFPAVIVTVLLFGFFGAQQGAPSPEIGDVNILQVLPYAFVLIAAVVGMNVFAVLTLGIFASAVVGITVTGLEFAEVNEAIIAGFGGMIEIVVLAIFIGGLSRMLTRAGGIAFLLQAVTRVIRGRRSAEVGISAIVGLVDVAVANNTAALIAANDVSREIGREHGVDPRRTASLMDIFSSVAQGLIPYGNQILLLVGLGSAIVSPIEIIPYMWYPMILGAFAILSIYVPFADRTIRKNPWNWEKGMSEADARKAPLQQEAVLPRQ